LVREGVKGRNKEEEKIERSCTHSGFGEGV
jgi:hypothetical protein